LEARRLGRWHTGQQRQRMRRIGVLMPTDENDPLAKARISAFVHRFSSVILHAVEDAQSAAWRLDPVRLDLKLVFKLVRGSWRPPEAIAARP
jgi:hypothetical protein